MTTLRKLQLIQLEILDEFVRICEIHNLTYFLAYGTLIGAVRHKGFIPWDDDLDMGMPREDYEKFIVICKNERNSSFFLQESRTYSKYWHIYAKFRKNNTQKIEVNPPPFYPGEHRGINIDVFPYDNVSSSDFIRKTQEFLITKITFLLFEKRGYKSNSSFFYRLLKQFFVKLLPFRFFHRLAFSIMTLKTRNHSYFTSWGGTYGYKKETFPQEIILPVKKLEFEGRSLSVPNNTHVYLTQIYGNYMQLPPENARNIYDPGVIFDVEKNEKETFDELRR